MRPRATRRDGNNIAKNKIAKKSHVLKPPDNAKLLTAPCPGNVGNTWYYKWGEMERKMVWLNVSLTMMKHTARETQSTGNFSASNPGEVQVWSPRWTGDMEFWSFWDISRPLFTIWARIRIMRLCDPTPIWVLCALPCLPGLPKWLSSRKNNLAPIT